MATIIANPLNGQFLTEVVGGSGLEFNREPGYSEDPDLPPPYGQFYTFGYPGNFDKGQTLTYCSGDTSFIAEYPVISCNMIGGASGGPWFLNFDERSGIGIQNSVNHTTLWGGALFGSYFGKVAEALYEKNTVI